MNKRKLETVTPIIFGYHRGGVEVEQQLRKPFTLVRYAFKSA